MDDERSGDTPGFRIRERRMEIRRFRDSQRSLAKEVGVPRERVSLWENDRSTPSGENLVSLARALNVTPEWILHGENGESSGGAAASGPAQVDLPEPSPHGSPAEQLLHHLGVRAGLRRVARELTDKDLIAVAYTIATTDRWPVEEFRKLDAWRDAILGERAEE